MAQATSGFQVRPYSASDYDTVCKMFQDGIWEGLRAQSKEIVTGTSHIILPMQIVSFSLGLFWTRTWEGGVASLLAYCLLGYAAQCLGKYEYLR